MKAKIDMWAALIGGWLGYFVGGMDGMLIALMVFMVIDYITGVAGAYINGELSSGKGFRGILKKCLMLLLVCMAHMADTLVIGSGAALRTAVILELLCNEALSACENLASCGVSVPLRLKDALAKLKDEG